MGREKISSHIGLGKCFCGPTELDNLHMDNLVLGCMQSGVIVNDLERKGP